MTAFFLVNFDTIEILIYGKVLLRVYTIFQWRTVSLGVKCDTLIALLSPTSCFTVKMLIKTSRKWLT